MELSDKIARARRGNSLTAGHNVTKMGRTMSVQREAREPNAVVWSDAVALRQLARQLELNSDIARHGLDILVDKTIGRGLHPEPAVLDAGGEPHIEINQRLAELYDEWSEFPEVTDQHDQLAAQRLCARTMFRDGEMFYQHVIGATRNFQYRTRIPYAYEMMEPDLVPMDLNEGSTVQGIILNGWRQPQAYRVLTVIPDLLFGIRVTSIDQTIAVPADRMGHIALRERIGQIRGLSQFASVIQRLGDINEIDESERVAARVAAAMCAAIVKGTSEDYQAATNMDRELKFKPGMIFDDLLPGERVESLTSNRPNNEIITFRDANVRAAAGGLRVGFSHLANSYNGSYSAQRQELVEQDTTYKVMSASFVSRMARPQYRMFVQACVLAGLVDTAGADLDTIDRAHWVVPVMPWVDPQKEYAAMEKALELRVVSRQHIQRERGLSPREMAIERRMDEQLDESLGLLEEPPAAAQAAPSNEETDADGNVVPLR